MRDGVPQWVERDFRAYLDLVSASTILEGSLSSGECRIAACLRLGMSGGIDSGVVDLAVPW